MSKKYWEADHDPLPHDPSYAKDWLKGEDRPAVKEALEPLTAQLIDSFLERPIFIYDEPAQPAGQDPSFRLLTIKVNAVRGDTRKTLLERIAQRMEQMGFLEE